MVSFEGQLVEVLRCDGPSTVTDLMTAGHDMTGVDPATNTNAFFFVVTRPHRDFEVALSVCEMLKEKGADPCQVDVAGQTALFYAARDGNGPCAEFLLRHGCSASHADKNKQTPLFYAARDGRMAMCETLCSKGADVNFKDAVGETALFYAAREGHVETLEKLVELGADPTHRDAMRKTAAMFAKEQKHHAAVNFLTKAMNERKALLEKEGLGVRLGAGGFAFGGRLGPGGGGMHMAAHPHPYAGGQRRPPRQQEEWIDEKGEGRIRKYRLKIQVSGDWLDADDHNLKACYGVM
uniref:Uncharacterized protein n=1 Tax=Chromera velia CCMP2878 TaxID=1169474 RepID=A0A0G4I6T8_9ALVE|mmetsp:Transcript_10633/g.20620  ORF Transcript_10633/g.20620 Transcript_10633/m.20620 type:complete len:294 (-) Transcript_10633:276-1157(-)|eukprot:Cvel_11424.t1-p1 / transcript=Cvel_11424.t1 / gene=Cvel_11424 / organism=Chromera_velia_CCMP2878 / gene_product=Ankyrin homolog, putative / transcript_product=Ankyrin homolog, putative / location=Cvel_scaffold718:15708-18330(+) / protein_length=293 / sequence_SO=supercontig / SO=protein_coding / is_pseudo=false